MTLRTRLIAILAGLIAAGLLASGVATYSALRNFLYERVDSQLRDMQPIAVKALNETLQSGGPILTAPIDPRGFPVAVYAEARDASGQTLASRALGFPDEDPEYVPRLPHDLSDRAVDEAPFTVSSLTDDSYQFRALAASLVGGGTFAVAIPLEDVQGTLRRLLVIEVLVAVAVVGAIALAAWLIVRKELQPLDAMAGAATEIAGGDLSRRVDEGPAETEVGRLGRALNRMLEQIEQAFDARKASEDRMRRFLGDASHELRTPLTSIRGYAELFRHGAAERPDDLALSMRRIEEEAARMGVLVDDLLLLASADRMRPLEVGGIALRALLEDVAEDARVADPGRPVELEVTDDVTVEGDEARLRQAVTNLVRNALVHTPPRTRVALALARDGDEAVVTVEDEGEGLSDEVLAHAFERFWRHDPSRTRDTGGAGLGLAIVDAIVRAHGGSVAAENVAGAGARFTIRLPSAQN